MPILDHLAPDIMDIAPFESFHSAWTTYIVEDLNLILPEGFLAIPKPITTRAEFPTEFEVFVDYIDRGRHITVGAIEIVSRSNKDRPRERDSFVSKCKNLLAKQVSLIVIDILTRPAFNLHNQLLQAIHATTGYIDTGAEQPLYCAAYRACHREDAALGDVDLWTEALSVGAGVRTHLLKSHLIGV
ncbi:DUF4058 family protein [Candidatus Entotheonella palauensis]|uniref:DUF4058 family protein n=1 Tax=Candidatus Entotheonella palauensis TaxID=93172 RepID=UPI000B7D0AF3|nr:DUF4058 family protein [Candidatus Entotheonella palauensis]